MGPGARRYTQQELMRVLWATSSRSSSLWLQNYHIGATRATQCRHGLESGSLSLQAVAALSRTVKSLGLQDVPSSGAAGREAAARQEHVKVGYVQATADAQAPPQRI